MPKVVFHYFAASGQWQAPPWRFIIVTAIEVATGTDAVKAPFAVATAVPNGIGILLFLHNL